MGKIACQAEDKCNVLKILYDEYPENPREWDNLGTMVCGHKRYLLGDKEAKNIQLYNNWEEWLQGEILKPNGGRSAVVFLPVYMYNHSGITISTHPFSCPWDSGQLGWIYCTKKRFIKKTLYTEAELFSTDRNRTPVAGEHVKIKGHENKGVNGFGIAKTVNDKTITVDFDHHKIPEYRSPANIVTVPLADVAETMANRAVEMLQNEVRVYDAYLRGDVYRAVLEKKVYRKPCYPYHNCEQCGLNCPEYKLQAVKTLWGYYRTDWEYNGLACEFSEVKHLIRNLL